MQTLTDLLGDWLGGCRAGSGVLEPLEQRILLSGNWVTSLGASGGVDHPFDVIEVHFSQPVQDGTFTAADVAMTGPGGAITPVVTPLNSQTYELRSTGGMQLATYTLVIGPNILDLSGQPMNQDHDAAMGEAGQDNYRARLSAEGMTIAAADSSYDGWNLVLCGGNSTLDGTHALASLTLLGGAVLTHSAATAAHAGAMQLTITDGLVIDATSKIDVTGKGYLPALGSLDQPAASRGNHGGLSYSWAGVDPGQVYGDYRNPAEPGAGGSGKSGGGVVRLAAATAVIDGQIIVDGADAGFSSGGAGGSVWLDVGSLGGIGSVSADGGNGEFAGGGGRVAVYYDTLDGFDLSRATTLGGVWDGHGAGSAGTVYLQQTGQRDQLRIDSHGSITGMWTPLGAPGDSELAVDELVISGAGVVAKPDHQMPIQVDSLTISGGAALSHRPATETAVYSLDVHVAGTLTIGAGSKIDVTGMGYIVGRTHDNSSLGAATGDAGASYGGIGFDSTNGVRGLAYGDFRNPTEPGAGQGGGLVRITADTVVIDGQIVADGGRGDYYAGGSGGGIRLDVGTLSGGGTITANGGGQGGGGRVALYYTTLSGFDVDHVRAVGARGVDWRYGGVGTVYLKQAVGEGELRIKSFGADVGQWTPLGLPNDDSFEAERLVIAGVGVVVLPDHPMPIVLSSLDISDGAIVTHLATTPLKEQSLTLEVAGAVTIAAGSGIDVSLKGYGEGYTLGNTRDGASIGYSGGSYGGRGGQPDSNLTYGDALYPDELGSGGALFWQGSLRAGGGLVHLTAGSIQMDGFIHADGGRTSSSDPGGGGSGGSILINTGTLAGTGQITAVGGYGYNCNGGGGGRIAIYTWAAQNMPVEQISAAAGGGVSYGNGVSEDGTVTFPPMRIAWAKGLNGFCHGQKVIRWAMLGVDPSTPLRVTLTAQRDGQTTVLADDIDAWAGMTWNTTTVPDGRYQLRAVFRNSDGNALGECTLDVLLYNVPAWHSGHLTQDETWTSGTIHVVEDRVIVPSGITLTIEPGTVVKFARHTKLIIEGGGTLNALSTASEPVTLTSLADDTVGGDTNLDASASVPMPGDWNGIAGGSAANINLTSNVELRYALFTHSGTLQDDEVWLGNCVHEITASLFVPQGLTLTIMPGAIVKMADFTNIFVSSGAILSAQGLPALPIIFTSMHDDAAGGDSNADGEGSVAAAGDWDGLIVTGQADLEHVDIRYAGGSSDHVWRSNTAALVADTNSHVVLADSIIQDAFFDGIITRSVNLVVRNTIITRTDRAIYYNGRPSQFLNCTLDDNRIGVLVKGSGDSEVIVLANTLITNSATAGIQLASGAVQLTHSDVWSSRAGSVNYSGMTDQTGVTGNISADPQYTDASTGDYRLTFSSPAIDAGNGALAPLTDFRGAARVDDGRTPNTGTPAGNDFADLGAFEYIDSAASNIDITVTDITGPASVSLAQNVLLEWTVKNVGSEAVHGPWRDSVYLALNATDPSARYLAGAAAVGEGVVLQPGESFTASAHVLVPAGFDGDNYWMVVANSYSDLAEGFNHDNNTFISAGVVELSYPQLAVDGAAATGHFNLPGDAVRYVLYPSQANQDIRLSLDLQGGGAVELYVAFGRPASRTDFDLAASAPGRTSQSFQISQAQPDTPCYVLAYASSVIASPQFELSAATAQFAVDRASPSAGGNIGNVTLGIYGSDIPEGVQPLLLGPGGEKFYGGNVYPVDATVVYSTFDLQGAPAGDYDLRLIAPDGSFVTKPAAFRVAAGLGPNLQANLVLPSLVRPGRPYSFQIEYENVGDTDLISPILTVSVADGRAMGLVAGRADGWGELSFLGYSSTGPAGILQPGDKELVTVYATATSGEKATVSYNLVSRSVNPAYPRYDKINWQSLRSQYLPGVSTDSYSPLWQVFSSMMGGTWDELNAHLAEMLTRQVAGGDTPDAVLGHLMQQAYADAMDRGGGLADNETPWVLSALPNEGYTGGLESVDIIFSKSMDASSFTGSDVTVVTPTGTLSASVTAMSGRVFRVSFLSAGEPYTPKDKGAYTLVIASTVTDLNGVALDQDRDGIIGEAADDAFRTTVDLDRTHWVNPVLHVVSQWPDAQVDVATGTGLSPISGANPPLAGPYALAGIDHLTVQFSRPIQFLTFTPRDITLTGPDGLDVPVTDVKQLSSTIWQVDFVRQTALGQYNITIGAEIRDQANYQLDQNLDGLTEDKPTDQYHGSFSLVDIHGPHVVATSPQDYLASPSDHLDLTFNEPINPATLSAGAISIIGPNGPVTVTGVTAIGATSYRVSFATLPAAGRYDVTVASSVTDVAGNAMDQDQDGLNGAAGDAYAGRFFLLTGPQDTLIQGQQQLQFIHAMSVTGAGDPDPVDSVVLMGHVSYSGLSAFFGTPHVRIQLWEQDGQQDATPGISLDDDLMDDLISDRNLLTGTDQPNSAGDYIFISDIFGQPILKSDPDDWPEGRPPTYYVVILADNDAAVTLYSYAWTDDPSLAVKDSPFWTSIQMGETRRYFRRYFDIAGCTLEADQPGRNVELVTRDLELDDPMMMPSEYIYWGAGWMRDTFGQLPRTQIKLVLPSDKPDDAMYYSESDYIYMGNNRLNYPGIVLHEYGHGVQNYINGFKGLDDPADPRSGTHPNGNTFSTAYGIIQESSEFEQTPAGGWVGTIDPPVYHDSKAYVEAWASFVAAWGLAHMPFAGTSKISQLDKTRGTPRFVESNNWWMSFDAYGLANNDDAHDSFVDPVLLNSAFYQAGRGINKNANTGDVILGAIESIMWDLADGINDDQVQDPRGLWNAFMAASAPGADIRSLWNALPHTPGIKAIFIDHGVDVADDDHEGNDRPANAYDLGTLYQSTVLNGLVMSETDKGNGDWFKFYVPAVPDATHDQTYNLTVRLDWNGRYGDLDIYGKNLTTGIEDSVILQRAMDHDLLIFPPLHADQDYYFLVGVAGYGALTAKGEPSGFGGDMVPDYSLAINRGGVPRPDDDDDEPDPEDDDDNKEGGSHDPNAMIGPAGAGAAGFIPAGQAMPYTILFENSGPQAALPAQEVRLSSVLDSDLDLSTFRFTQVVFNNHVIDVPSQYGQNWHTIYDLRPEQNLLVDIDLGIDPNTGEIHAVLASLDPLTMQLTQDPLEGLLPVNDANHSGEGYVSYAIDQKAQLADGTQITGQARIVFDVNPPMDTNLVLNTVDSSAPASHITSPTASQGSATINLDWQAVDVGSGVDSVELYVSDNQSPYVLAWQGAGDSYAFTGQPDHAYRFYTIAIDAAGNREDAPNTPDATITLWPTTTITLAGKAGKLVFADGDGTAVTITWSGDGSAILERWDNPVDHRGDIRLITANSPSGKSSLTITSKGKGAAALTSVGGIVVHGALKSLSAKTTSLLGNLVADSSIASVSLDDVGPGSLISIGPRQPGDAKTMLTATFDLVTDARLTSWTPLASLSVTQWLDAGGDADRVEAPSIGKLTTKGDKTRTLAGDFEADLMLNGMGVAALKTTLGSVSIAGSLRGARWDVVGSMGNLSIVGAAGGARAADGLLVRSTGSMGAVTVGSAGHADFQAGINTLAGGDIAITRRADAMADFQPPGASIASFSVKPAKGAAGKLFVDSNVSAARIGAVTLANAQFNNDQAGLSQTQDDFGIWAREVKSVKHIDLVSPKDKLKNWTWKPLGTLPGGLDDLNIVAMV